MQFIKEKLALNNPILAGITAVFILALAIMLGVIIGTIFVVDDALARENNIGGVTLALPTSIYDLDGELITEFFGDERRELLDFNDIPRITVQALISREDRGFFDHNGFSIRGTTRAVVMAVQTRLRFISGGSTITQQLAGHLYANRATDNTLWRKVRELWWAWQLEKHRSKHEILETYLNMMPFGHNTYGAQAASRFFFGHGLENTNAAESAMIVIQLANPSGLYSPIRRPPFARETQGRVIRMMVNNGFVDEEQAFQYYDSYWANYDWSRNSRGTAFFEREDRAPYFSEYIRGELHAILPGRLNIYRDGYHVYTTLNSRFQRIAEEEIERGLQIASDRLRAGAGTQQQVAFDMYLPIIELLALNFNIPALQLEGGQLQRRAVEYFNANVNPTLDMVTAMFGLSFANNATQIAWRNHFASDASSQIQAALITLNQSNGYIVSIIGGRGFDRLNQLNRAVNARIMPGSAIKPFYFAEAIASGRLTAASNLHNFARFWTNEDGTIYAPTNYGGAGSYSNQGVRLREALALSLNIPAIAVLEDVGFDAAIARTSRLMGITDPAEVARTFPRVWSLGLGIIGTTPLNMVRAFAVMANNGRETMPIAIRQIYDRNGRLVLDVENDPRRLARMRGEEGQILSPQAAFIMTNIMEDSVRYGTFYWSFVHTAPGGSNSQGLPTFNQPISGKTGTSQNWSDAWAIGYTPYYTTAVWLGFDRGGQTLGQGNEASSSSAHIFMRYMRRIHEGLPRREFERPSGIINATVDRESGLLPGPRTISTINEIFIAGTVPNRADDSIWIGGEADAGRIEWDWDDGGFGFNNNNAPLQLAPLGEFTLAPLELSGGNFAFSDDDFDDDDDGAAPVNFEPDIGSTDDFSLN